MPDLGARNVVGVPAIMSASSVVGYRPIRVVDSNCVSNSASILSGVWAHAGGSGVPTAKHPAATSPTSIMTISLRQVRAASPRSGLGVEPLESRIVPAITFRFDYTFDQSGFFENPSARATLQLAADIVSARLTDSLAALVPERGNTWDAIFANPLLGRTSRLENLSIGTDEVLVFVGAANLPGGTLGVTGPGSAVGRGTAAWRATVESRGQVAPPADVGPWGGMVVFDTDVAWNFGVQLPARTQYDFLAVAEHELLHVLGFTAGNPSFDRFVTPTGFIGPSTVSIYGSAVPLEPGPNPGHWDEGVVSDGRLAAMTPSDLRGLRASLTTLDWAGLSDVGWSVSAGEVAVVSPPPPAVPPGIGTPRVAVGSGDGSEPVVTWLDRTGQAVSVVPAFGDDYAGGVRVATADFNGDGIEDLVVGSGPGNVTRVRVLNGADQSELFQTTPFETTFTGGVFVAVGDISGDGVPEVVVTPDEGGGPRVRVFHGTDFSPIADFLGIDDPAFRGGARAAVGDVDGDDTADLLVAAGFGGGPRVSGYVGSTVASGKPAHLFADFFAFETSLRNGVYLAVGDLSGDGMAEIVAGAGPGGGPRVTAFDGAALIGPGRVQVRADLFAGDPGSRAGVRVAVADLDGDRRADIIAGAGFGGGAWVTAYSGADVTSTAPPTPVFDYTVYPGSFGGVFVG